MAARSILQLVVAAGRDVTDPNCIHEDVGQPDFGSMGLHLLGLPEGLARPPHEERAHRLFERIRNLRARIDQGDRKSWFEAAAVSMRRFMRGGELPEDPLLREAALVGTELLELMRCFLGAGDAGALEELDRPGAAPEPDREARRGS